jgi:signal transduction histidine kinase
MIKRLLLLLVILFGIVVVLSLFKEQSKGSNTVLSKNWKFHEGDNPEWASPGFDDNSWINIDPAQDIHDSFPGLKKSNIGWIRLKIPLASLPEGPLAANIQQSVASEMYLNGKLIKRYGQISTDPRQIKAYDPLWRPLIIPFSKDSLQVLAIRVAASPGTLYTTIFEIANPLVSLQLHPYDEAVGVYRSVITYALGFEFPLLGISIVLMILHLSFYAWNFRQKANLYFALYAISAIIGYGLQLYFWGFNTSLTSRFFIGNLIFFLFIVSNLFMLFSLQKFLDRKNDFYFRFILFAAIAGCVLNAYPYNTGWRMGGPVVQLLIQLNIIRIAFIAIAANKKGAWIIAIGGLATLVFFGSFIVQGTFTTSSFIESLSPQRIVFYILFALSLPAAVSTFLALDFAFTNEVLEQKIRENNDLAEKNISQQKERQELLSSMNQQLEIQVKDRTEELRQSLNHLESTQAQLIQSEKMASLGELTAGIAHEIQNPLNFVNNFSEINVELMSEMKDEIEKGNMNEVKAIADDVIGNEEKINFHGKRADAIVKGMLQHSRSSTGKKELTDINALADEYLRLAFHGLRAKEKSFNVTLKTEFDKTIEKINIIPQDFGRVLLNLYNNAFYAVSEKSKSFKPPSDNSTFEPCVAVSTKMVNSHANEKGIEIRVKDNGNGIPQKVLDKIFQPFFTTKPTGQGTGLGLSLAYDIIKAHGGKIEVESWENQGCDFVIQLPVDS